MKQTIIYYVAFLPALFLLMIACNGMNDGIQEYLDRGEVNYIGRVDSATTIGGNNRIRINWLVGYDPRIESCIIYWNSKRDSAIFPVDKSKLDANGYASVTFNLPEGTYIFEMSHTGIDGYKSVGYEVTGKVYGELYQSMLKARRVIGANTSGTFESPVTLEWSAADESVLKTVLTYKLSSGIPVERIVTPTETNVTITDYEWGGTYSATTYFIPESGALDTFVIAAPDGTFPVEYWFDKKGWIPYALATHNSDGDGIACLLDGNYDSYWHSPYSESYNISTKPLYVGFDMLTEKYIKAIKLEKRYDTRIVEFRTSTDNENWETIGTVTIDNGNAHGTGTLTLNTPVNARYVRLYQTKSGNADGRGSVFQIDVLGSEITPATGIFQYDRSTWQALSVSDETASDGGGKNSLIDNNLTNYWHSGSITVPHWAIIDMGESKDIVKIVTYRRRKNTDTKTVQYFVGNDPNPAAGSWVKIAEGSLPALIGSNSGGEILTIDIPASVNTQQGRYLKLVLPDTNNGNNSSTSVAEIYVYGKIRN